MTPAFRIRAISGGASISGSLLGHLTEEDIRSAPANSLTFTVTVRTPNLALTTDYKTSVPMSTASCMVCMMCVAGEQRHILTLCRPSAR